MIFDPRHQMCDVINGSKLKVGVENKVFLEIAFFALIFDIGNSDCERSQLLIYRLLQFISINLTDECVINIRPLFCTISSFRVLK